MNDRKHENERKALAALTRDAEIFMRAGAQVTGYHGGGLVLELDTGPVLHRFHILYQTPKHDPEEGVTYLHRAQAKETGKAWQVSRLQFKWVRLYPAF